MAPVAELFRVPPAEFTAVRDALVKQRKAEGDKEGAAAIKALRRPSVGAWAVNQVARDHPELVDAVVEAGAAVRAAQEALLAGGERGDLRAATGARRDAVRAATKAAVALAGAAHRDTITATFDAAASDEDAAAAVRAGTLQKELAAPSGFELLGVVPDAVEEDADEPEDDGGARAEAQARAEAARAAATVARTRADDAAEHRRELERQLADATDAAEEAERLAVEAEELAAEAEAALAGR